MCDCISIIEGKLLEKCLKEKFRKPFKKVEIETMIYLVDNTMKSGTFSNYLITLKGQQKKIKEKILHSFCSFCGEKYKK